MSALDYVLYLFVGSLAGILSGLLGLGGGIILVPALILVFTANGLSVDVVTHLAIGTSLATIVITSATATFTHHQVKAVRWDIVRSLVLGLVMGSVLGGLLASVLHGHFLQLVFGCLMIIVALQLLLTPEIREFSNPSKSRLTGAGVVIGSLSSLLGIGGGTLTTPFLTSFGTPIRNAVAISAACGIPIAVAGSLTYGYSGLTDELLPEHSLGYIFIPAWLCIVLTSMPFARLGALLVHRINERLLKQLFAGIIFVLGIRFVGLNLLVTVG
jgi:hypothetical protein